ncbi:hypothetical protein CsSME_00015405 [Camellia sinensis var. sinensis]
MADRKPQNNVFSGQTQTHIPALDPPQKPKRNKYAFACAILASMTSILLGCDGGVMSGAGLFIKDDLKISDVPLEVLMGIMSLYSSSDATPPAEPPIGWAVGTPSSFARDSPKQNFYVAKFGIGSCLGRLLCVFILYEILMG